MKRIIKFTYVVAMPLMMLTLDFCLYQLGKWGEMWSQSNILLMAVFGVMHLATIMAVAIFLVRGEDTTLIPTLEWEKLPGLGLATGIIFEKKHTIVILGIGCVKITFDDAKLKRDKAKSKRAQAFKDMTDRVSAGTLN